MATNLPRLASLFRSAPRTLGGVRKPLICTPALRTLATKHPNGFVPPTEDELLELRERVQEFTSQHFPEDELCAHQFVRYADNYFIQDVKSRKKSLPAQTPRMSFPQTCGRN